MTNPLTAFKEIYTSMAISSDKLKIKPKGSQTVASRPSASWLKKNKLMIIQTYKDKDGKTRYVLADTFDS